MLSETKKWLCGCPVLSAPGGNFVVTHKNTCTVNAKNTYLTADEVNADVQPSGGVAHVFYSEGCDDAITAGAAHMADKEEPTTLDNKTRCALKEMPTASVEKPKRFYRVLELEVSSSDAPSIGINVDPWQDNGAGVSITLTLVFVCICLNLGFWFTDESETQPSSGVTPDVKGMEEKHA